MWKTLKKSEFSFPLSLSLYPSTYVCEFIKGTHYLLDEIDRGLQVHAEINEYPINTLPFVLLLFQNEHVMVKELLQPLVGIVYAQLVEIVKLNHGIEVLVTGIKN